MNEPKQELMAPKADPFAQIDRTLDAMVKAKFTIADMKEMFALRREIEQHEAQKDFIQAMAAFKSEPIVIEKRRKVDYKTKAGARIQYDYAELADYTEVLGPLMSKQRLFYRWDTVQKDGQIYVTCIVTHANGHSISKTLHGPLDDSGQKNVIQQLGSTESFLQRYTLAGITGVAARGVDTDGRTREDDVPPVHPQQDLIDDLFAKIGLAESMPELQKLKAEILTVEAEQRRYLMGSYNTKMHELAPPKPDVVQPAEAAQGGQTP